MELPEPDKRWLGFKVLPSKPTIGPSSTEVPVTVIPTLAVKSVEELPTP